MLKNILNIVPHVRVSKDGLEYQTFAFFNTAYNFYEVYTYGKDAMKYNANKRGVYSRLRFDASLYLECQFSYNELVEYLKSLNNLGFINNDFQTILNNTK